ncbi:YTH domain-containing protein ECT2 isoform X2 [Aristolochia californica]|uniref:YTH domain-containing protein ECT2 isoform X2 n=1 Tax=Aristolochia californica TaxID=171875 RepID=UPI0035DEB2B3
MDSKADSLEKLADHDMTSGKDGVRTDSTSDRPSSGISASNTKRGVIDQSLATKPGVYYTPTSCYGYYYPGYDATYPEWEDQGYVFAGDGSDMQYSGIQSSNGSVVYYMPGYNAYTPGTLTGSDGQCVGQQSYFPSSGPDAMSSYSYDLSLPLGSSTNQVAGAGPRSNGSASSRAASLKLKSSNFINTNIPKDSKVSALPANSRSRPPISQGFSVTAPHFEPLHKVSQQGSASQTAGQAKGYCYPTPFSPYSNQWHGGFYPQNGYPGLMSRGRTWAGNDRYKGRDRFNRNGELDASSELTRGPRAYGVKNSLKTSSEKSPLSTLALREQYNQPDFETKYEQAMFFVIKSFSEDDIHKSIKYNVWASTPGGNKKLDIAYHDAEARSAEKGTKCPIFLFFSVNGSGQFVGMAEMIGKVDFKKTMEFWQQDKWTGFFPLKWHIIKDVSNSQLRHIILENNDNKPVTNSRDTQEIKFKQGLEMLTIFKSHPAETSLLDDFPFYEDRERSFQAKKNTMHQPSQLELKTDGDSSSQHLEAEVSMRAKKISPNTKQSLIPLAQNLGNLSINSARKDLTVT